jgi:hypothetical protein
LGTDAALTRVKTRHIHTKYDTHGYSDRRCTFTGWQQSERLSTKISTAQGEWMRRSYTSHTVSIRGVQTTSGLGQDGSLETIGSNMAHPFLKVTGLKNVP